MSFWTRWAVKKFNQNHDDQGKFSSGPGAVDSGPMLTETFDDQQRAAGYNVPNPDPRDDKMAVLNALLDKAKMRQAADAEAKHPNHYGLEDFILASDEN